jgi:hypothetical protein
VATGGRCERLEVARIRGHDPIAVLGQANQGGI